VFACIGEGERKNRDFRGKMMDLEKVKYGCGAIQKRWKALQYCGF
jgi:hypothetical protein